MTRFRRRCLRGFLGLGCTRHCCSIGINQSYPYILKMCRVLQPAAKNLVQNHRLTVDDDLATVTLSLKSLMKEANVDPEELLRFASRRQRPPPCLGYPVAWVFSLLNTTVEASLSRSKQHVASTTSWLRLETRS
jgi:hypothetical protein